VLDEVRSDLVQAIIGGDNLIILAQEVLQQGFLVRIEVCLLDLLGHPVIEVLAGDSELLAPALVNELDRGLVFLRALEVVAGDIGAENAPGQVVVLKQRGAGEPDERSIR